MNTGPEGVPSAARGCAVRETRACQIEDDELMSRTNHLGQPIGKALPEGWGPPPAPSRVTLQGRLVTVAPISASQHGSDLYDAFRKDITGAGWTYMPNGPYDDRESFLTWLQEAEAQPDPVFFAFLDASTGRAIGYGSLMRIKAAMASVEVGNIRMSPLLQRTAKSTEALHLLASYVFELGYRRFEWKCDALNAPSRRAALRLGFIYEGIFRKAMHYKGRSRDTAWFAIIEDDWPAIRQAHRLWLDPENFHPDGSQKTSLSALVRQAQGQSGNAL